ncbi:NADPH-dependent oxidoreductase [Sphingomonas ginkgonis]|uniref:NADPH-dependent oxidoreductase n=1 Tax=Sphingomonas ginkgonis TaxID=2315330 RepID=A0A429V9R6_9SPHN|nr:NAD(P)H-dependent oxidoreductase [Sphingomonas ginkgonis]RST30665.1 NADPH-dependent oxidoreductase [Sphingomonas ginkgonis]
MSGPRIVGFGGTTREGSTGEQLIRAVLERCARGRASTRLFAGAELAALPHFAPEQPERSPAQRDFVEAIRAADGIVIGTPGYHGGVSGLVKNAIDLLEDLRADQRPYFEGRPVGLIVCAAGWQATGVTLAALRGIVHAMRGWPTPLGLTVNTVAQKPFDPAGALADEAVRGGVEELSRQLMSFVRP